MKLLFSPIYLFGRPWDIHVMVFSSMFTLLGWQILNLGISAKVFAHTISLEDDSLTKKIMKLITFKLPLFIGLFIGFFGILVIGYVFYAWAKNDFGPLWQVKTTLMALILVIMGIQAIFTEFFTSLIQIKYR
jgi:hypothetical protein